MIYILETIEGREIIRTKHFNIVSELKTLLEEKGYVVLIAAQGGEVE